MVHLHPNRFLKKLLVFCRESMRLRFRLAVTRVFLLYVVEQSIMNVARKKSHFATFIWYKK